MAIKMHGIVTSGEPPENPLLTEEERGKQVLQTVFLILLVILLIGALPSWPYSTGWGYYPSGGLGLLLIVMLVILLFRPRTL